MMGSRNVSIIWIWVLVVSLAACVGPGGGAAPVIQAVGPVDALRQEEPPSGRPGETRPAQGMQPALGASLVEPTSTAAIAPRSQVIGHSVQGRPIWAHQFGDGPVWIGLIGGIHGGYESNSVGLLERVLDEFRAGALTVPESTSLVIVPVMNPDGLTKSGLQGRVNANGVDLNRNWGCGWQAHTARYRQELIFSAGKQPFSEPETRSVRDFLLANPFRAVVFYHSQGGFIFYGRCGNNSRSRPLAKLLSTATGYPVSHPPKYNYNVTGFTGPISGEATDYLDEQGIPAVGVELSSRSHDQIDWDQNLRGIIALLAYATELDQPEVEAGQRFPLWPDLANPGGYLP